MSVLSRRTFGRHALIVLAAVPLAACGGGELECESGALSADQRAMRGTLHYVDNGPDATRHCVGCALYVGNAAACGTCTVVAGAIHPRGTCDAFAARS